MFQKTSTRIIVIISIVIANFALDQFTKNIARKNIADEEVIEVLSSYFVLTKAENTGAFLSMGDKLSGVLGKIVLIGIPLTVLITILYYAITDRKLNTLSIIGFAFVSGGGFANLIDRILYGSVTDFMFIDLGFAHTGVFNTADVSIMLGIGFIIISQFINKSSSKPKQV